MTTLVDRIHFQWERVYPLVCGLVGLAVGFFFMPKWLHHIHEKTWAIENVFVAAFTIATVMAGFGLAVYTFLLTTESGFIGRAKRSIYYKQMLTYVVTAAGLSALLAVISIPGMIVKEAPITSTIYCAYAALWSSSTCWTLAAGFRAGHIFSIFAREHH